MGRNTMYLSPIPFRSCCADCKPPKRNPYCHSECPEYLAEKQKRDRELEQFRHDKKGLYQSWELQKEAIEKTKRRNHDRNEK